MNKLRVIATLCMLVTLGGIMKMEAYSTDEYQREYVVYKPSTNYIHKNTCHWFNDECYEIDITNGVSNVNICTECNPVVEIINTYEEVKVYSGEYIGNFKLTWYVATGNQTASGTWPSVGRTVAMNNEQRKSLGISYGDQIYIEGKGEYTVEDSGCAWGVIDIFCNTVDECYNITSYADVYLD